ncbi:MAG: hypothetical protein WBO92_02215 [Candidatus Moraniibacteriota bacterium]
MRKMSPHDPPTVGGANALDFKAMSLAERDDLGENAVLEIGESIPDGDG